MWRVYGKGNGQWSLWSPVPFPIKYEAGLDNLQGAFCNRSCWVEVRLILLDANYPGTSPSNLEKEDHLWSFCWNRLELTLIEPLVWFPVCRKYRGGRNKFRVPTRTNSHVGLSAPLSGAFLWNQVSSLSPWARQPRSEEWGVRVCRQRFCIPQLWWDSSEVRGTQVFGVSPAELSPSCLQWYTAH